MDEKPLDPLPTEGSRTHSAAGWIRWVGTALSSLLFLWLLSRQNWSQTWASLSALPGWLLPLAVLLYFAGMTGNALRWFILLRGQEVHLPFGETLKIVLSGAFASNFLPSTVGGDSVRIVSVARFSGWTLSTASVVVDRLLNILVMLSLLPFSWLVFGPSAGAWMGGSLLRGEGRLLGSLPAVGKWRLRWQRGLRYAWAKVRFALSKWRHRPEMLLLALLVSYLARLVIFIGLWLLAGGLGIQVSLLEVIAVGAITYTLSLLPISVNGLGLREVTMTTLYMQLGASLEQASTLVVVTRFILIAETLPGALWLSNILVSSKPPLPSEKGGGGA